jgi:general secretion pathway protein D
MTTRWQYTIRFAALLALINGSRGATAQEHDPAESRRERAIKRSTPLGISPAGARLRRLSQKLGDPSKTTIPPPAGPAASIKPPIAGSPLAPPLAAALTPVEAKPSAPGEKEFNECLRIPARRRVKFTLKQGSELSDLVHWISGMTCKKFVLADSIRGQKVTIVSPTPVTAGEAYRAFVSALDVMGLTVVPAGRYLKIIQGNWAIQHSIPTYLRGTGRRLPNSDEVVTQIARVDHVNVNELLLVLNKMKSRSGDITAYKPTNVLIITDMSSNVRRLMRIIRELDAPTPSTAEKIWVVRLKSADADQVQKVLTQLFSDKGAQAQQPPIIRPATPGRPLTAENRPAEPVLASKIVADQASNSLIIVATATAFHRIFSLIKKLDVESDEVNQQIHVHYLENADSEEISNTLANLTGRGGGAAGGRGGARGGRPARAPRTAGSRQPGGQKATLFEGEMQISPDKATNSLVIVASPRDFLRLRKVIQKLDIPRRQVFIEAYIMEVELNKDRKLGFGYHGGGTTDTDPKNLIFGGVQHDGLGTLSVNPLSLMGLAVGARGALIEGTAELSGLGGDIPGFGVFFQALQASSNVNVLSSPHLLTTDNEQAEISVGLNLPFQGGFLGGGLGAAAGAAGAAGAANLGLLQGVSVQRQDVALKMKITPHVNESDIVRLELEQEVSDIIDPNYNTLGPATSKRTVKTTVVVRDQQTVVIGGLIKDKIAETVSKVPLLGDLPILGYLFKRTTRSVQKTNLLIVLTPYVIRDQSDLRRIFRKKLEDRREFIERFSSFKTDDPAHDIDYRHKHGLLSEMQLVSKRIEEEALLLKEAKKATTEAFAPVEIPEGMDMSKKGTEPSTSPEAQPTSPTLKREPPRLRPNLRVRPR